MRVTFFTFYLVISAIIILDYRIVSFNVRIVETSSRGVQCRRDTACVTNASERARRSSHGKQRSRLFQTFRENQNSDGIKEFMQSNPLTRVFYNIYSYFYWVPKKNMPYVTPFDWVRNSSLEFIAYYQFPQNLPPYIYLGDDYPDDFFCWGLPGATLPLGNWDPFGFHQVSSKVVRKYRESELKHGRLAMMAVIGFLAQESVGHPLHPEIGGMAITHMEQLQNQGLVESFFFQQLIFPGLTALAFDTNSASQGNVTIYLFRGS